MLLEVREVSRKTARDGRLEVTEESARRLRVIASPMPVSLGDAQGEATLIDIQCTCAKGGDTGGHRHFFVQSSLFSALPAGETIVLELLDGKTLMIARPHPLRPDDPAA